VRTKETELPILISKKLLKKEASINYPDEIFEAINKIDQKKLAENPKEQEQAKKIIKSWVKTLWSAMVIVSDKVSENAEEKQRFKDDFKSKLITYITHPDHGITHAYHVYQGMLYIDEKEKKKLKPGSEQDKQAQLMALLHDSMQTLPFNIKGDICDLQYDNPKNQHADIIADIVDKFGYIVGFKPNKIANFVFGLRHHDASYNTARDKEDHSKNFNYLSKLLHDADKIFGASYSKDIRDLVSGMMKRNYQANRGGKGSYILRDLEKSIRELIVYGDRCFSDALSLVFSELKIRMTTKTGKKIAKERKEYAVAQAKIVYGKYFDSTYNYIHEKLKPELEKIWIGSSILALSIVGMDQEEKQINDINSLDELKNLIKELYDTPIEISKAILNQDRYPDKHARGLKIRVYDKFTKKEVFLDPSIARFCFSENGKEKFLALVNKVFSDTNS
jgi:hypothetical protein